MLIVKPGTFKFFKTFLASIFLSEKSQERIYDLTLFFPTKFVVIGPLKIKAFPENSSAYFTFPLTVFQQQPLS